MEKKKFTKPELKIVNIAEENILQASADTPMNSKRITIYGLNYVGDSWYGSTE